MHEITGNVEVSFISKMIATLHPDMPIWDNLVFAWPIPVKKVDFTLWDSR